MKIIFYNKNNNQRKKYSAVMLLSAVLLINGVFLPCFAKTNKDEEEKQFTEVKSIDTGTVKTLENKTYDDALTVKEIHIDGNSLVNTENILNKINIKAGAKFNRDTVQEDLKNIYKMGYFTEKIKAVPRQTDKGITLYIQVEENVPVIGFNILGNNIISNEEIILQLKSQEGLPQNITELNNSIKSIEKLYADKGYILARVQKVSDDPDGMINIQINEGIINDIGISGNTKTRDFVIKRNITAMSGEVYNENKIKQDMARLFGTQAFSDVRRVISASPSNPDKYDIIIEVDEKRTGSISLGGGVDTETGFFGTVGYADNNFRGLGQELNANTTIGSGVILGNDTVIDKIPIQFEANFVEPRLKNTLNSLRLNAFVRDMASYQVPYGIERRFGTEIELARPIKKIPNLAGNVSMGIERVSMREGNEGETNQKFIDMGYTNDFKIAERARELQGGTYISVGPGVVYDSRNNIVNTTNGWYSAVSLKESLSISGDAGSFNKLNTSIKKYTPIGEKSTFMVGTKLSSRLVGDLPEFANFRLGGPYSIRGFREGEVGSGQGFMMATAEFRTPIPYMDRLKYKILRDVRAAFFVDAGTIFHKTFSTGLYDRPGSGISVGSGLMVPIPMLGPVRFDYGFPITNARSAGKHGCFSFGFGDR